MNNNTEKNGADILIVDDAPENLRLLAEMFKGLGYKVRIATGGAAALGAAAQVPPDLILLDVNMPDLDGYEVCRRLKADEKLREVPVIFLSALSEPADKVKAFTTGGADYICKPFQYEEVRARVETQLKLLAQQRSLRESYDKLLGLEKLRDNLVHMIVHDLRSPLSAICAFLGFLKKDLQGALTAQAAEDIDETQVAANKLIGMVSDLLDASKLEEGKMKLNLTDCDLAAVLGNVMTAMKPLARGRLITLEAGAGPVKVPADGELVARVAQNLLANALKFAPAEGGYVRLEVKPAGAGARISVANNGPAIPPELHQKLFEKFGLAEISRSKSGGYSTGLGLNFCKLAAEAHGGTIGVTSADGGETVFWLELPAGGPAAKPGPAQKKEAAHAG